MTTVDAWEHLTPVDKIRDRSKLLARTRINMLSELVRLRQRRGMKQKDIAEILEISQQAVSKLEGYDSNPTLETLERYANAVGAVLEISVQADPEPEMRTPNAPSPSSVGMR